MAGEEHESGDSARADHHQLDRFGQIGLIGVGAMGAALATRLIATGHRIVAYDARPTATAALEGPDLESVDSPAAVAARCDCLGIVVANETQLFDVMEGEDGVLSSIRPGTVVLVHSTVSPGAMNRLALLGDKFDVLDAAVTGGIMSARTGELTLYVGGSGEALERVRTLLADLGTTIIHAGPIGSGQRLKIINNMVVMITWVATSEAIRLAAGVGISEPEVLAALNAGSGGSRVSESWSEGLDLFRESPTGLEGAKELMRKDLRLAGQLAESANVEVPLAGAAIAEIHRVGRITDADPR